ncbi:MarR family transcriptional regulator [Priestia endophytica]|uniref:Uncharacterized protein n=1 Tax=Priestia endophytica DSM 13796 TaxID=1121089 RepID=A0A1I6C0A3_9BACI|nr:MarR family transcriptional regulator [Priestia endophytica]KYG33451.1 hypothetical protein AZF06_21645 [Priestia endophytica]SFQ86584.1 hypothetical protein SAMN02745910_04674 [Priestia endophytica DSM 13796]
MRYKVEGYTTLEKLQQDLEAIFQMVEEKTGHEPFIRGMDIYLRMENKTGKALEILDDQEYLETKRADRFAGQVLCGLKLKKKQVEIARELGIMPQRVSKIKKYLVEKGLY